MGGNVDTTKRKFANALRVLMQEKPLAKISATDIATQAGLSRKSFYNHFQDKYDLINWICYTQFVQARESVLSGNAWDTFGSFLELFATDPRFFSSAMQDMSQNSFGQYFSDMLFELVYGVTASSFRAKGVDDKWVGLAVSALVEDARLAIVIWLDDGDEPNPKELLWFLKAASTAFASMVCFEQALAENRALCERASDVVAAGFNPVVGPQSIELPEPHGVSERRHAFERIMARYR